MELKRALCGATPRAHALYMHTRIHIDTHQIAHAAGTIHQRDRAIGTWERGFHVLNNPY